MKYVFDTFKNNFCLDLYTSEHNLKAFLSFPLECVRLQVEMSLPLGKDNETAHPGDKNPRYDVMLEFPIYFIVFTNILTGYCPGVKG